MLFDNKKEKDTNIVKFKKGEVIFKEGEFGVFMYDIKCGTVKIIKDYGKETETVLTTLYDGDTFGEMGLVNSMPRSATAISMEKSTLVKIDNVGFGQYFHDKPSKVIRILQQLSTRMRHLTDEYMDACKTISDCLEVYEKNEDLSDELKSKMHEYGAKYKK